MSMAEATVRTAETSAPLLPALAERWSPRAFDAESPVDETALRSALEAARWSPSANNSQPWSFIVARRGSAAFDTIVANLMIQLGLITALAGALIVAVAETVDAEGKERRWATYDLGQAVAHLTIQAHHDGLHAHQMGGFDGAALREAFEIGDRFEPISITALGVLGDADALPEPLRERESAPRTRHPLERIVRVHD